MSAYAQEFVNDAPGHAPRTNRLGDIAPGWLADLTVVDGNPVDNISDIRRIELVMKDGVFYDPAAIYRALGVTPWQEAEGTRE